MALMSAWLTRIGSIAIALAVAHRTTAVTTARTNTRETAPAAARTTRRTDPPAWAADLGSKRGQMARLEGFEPPTNGFGSHYSIRLSYRRVMQAVRTRTWAGGRGL